MIQRMPISILLGLCLPIIGCGSSSSSQNPNTPIALQHEPQPVVIQRDAADSQSHTFNRQFSDDVPIEVRADGISSY